MEPDVKDRDFKQFQLESAAQQFADEGDYFPILALPSELISNVFSSLSIENRLRARVNKRLNKIEDESKYYVEKVLIEEKSINDPIEERETDYWAKNGYYRITFYKEKSYSSDCIKRLTQNVSIGRLVVKLSDATEFNREVCNLIKQFDIGTLDLCCIDKEAEIHEELMVDSFILDLTSVCKKLMLRDCEQITPQALHQIYKIIIEGSAKLDYLWIFNMWPRKGDPFLNLIGITTRNDRFFSNREIQLYERREDGRLRDVHIFDGFLQIRGAPYFRLELHKTRDSLEQAKKGCQDRGLVKIYVSLE